MTELLEILKILYSKNGNSTEDDELRRIIRLLESLYFRYILKPFKLLHSSQEFKIANDILTLEYELPLKKQLKNIKLKSKTITNDPIIKNYIHKDHLSREEIGVINTQVVDPHRHFVTVAFIADLISRENKKELRKWVVATVIGLLSASTIATLAILFIKGEI